VDAANRKNNAANWKKNWNLRMMAIKSKQYCRHRYELPSLKEVIS
jgi:hypothetical protein